jgi:methylaspartate mutase epsilon subunit
MLAARSFGEFVATADELVVQPRMGFSAPDAMRAGLVAVKNATATTVGTLTLDSYTRVGDHSAARAALARGLDLNGYPLVTHGATTTRAVLRGVQGVGFPVQVRHGSACPDEIITALVEAGLTATEGGPVSYCLPYSRLPLRDSVNNWARCCERLAAVRENGVEPHLETFGGCLMGQLCPPSLLVAVSVLEGLFFRQHGLRSISLSYAQQINAEQDLEALDALRRLALALLPDVDWHIVVYAYMGVYPRTRSGARLLLERAAELAVKAGAARLIVKTAAEAHRIPTIAENVAALEAAAAAARVTSRQTGATADDDSGIHAEATALVEAVLDLHDDIGQAMLTAFERGYLDVPFCLHPDNPGRSAGCIDSAGRLRWLSTGSLPISAPSRTDVPTRMSADGLLDSLSYLERQCD